MNAGALFLAIAACCLIVTHMAAIATKILQDLAWHELQEYCRRKRNRELFDDIHDHADEVAIGVETLLFLTATVFILAVVGLISQTHFPVNLVTFLVGLVIGTPILLAATLWIPMAVAELWGTIFLYHTWRVWRLTNQALRPLSLGAIAAMAILRRLKGQVDEPSEEEAFEDEIRAIVAEGQHDGFLEADAREMIEGVIELDDTDVADIMTSRSEMDAMPVDLRWDETLAFITKVGRTRIPVYDTNLDDIVGILYVKDLFVELQKPTKKRQELREILRECWKVPLRQRLDELLKNFLQTRNHLAIVVDEYEGVAGLVTIEDVLEQIVGEIVDESDKEEPAEIPSLSENTTEVPGRAYLHEINEELGCDLPEDMDFDTIGGFLMHQLGRIPQEGDALTWNELRFRVLRANRRRVQLVRIEMLRAAHSG